MLKKVVSDHHSHNHVRIHDDEHLSFQSMLDKVDYYFRT
jgi:hypothetical protein